MKRVAVIGAGISGLATAHALSLRGHSVRVFERNTTPGGLIRCKLTNGNLFHTCGGHVFNTKDRNVEKWFWSNFNKADEFVFAKRNSSIHFRQYGFVGYPIENHVFQLGDETLSQFISEMKNASNDNYLNFKDFLLKRFGKTLCELYFWPYNEKIWRCQLSEIPLSWLSGKLPMPTPSEMIEANKRHTEESQFVHASFWYPRHGGSQFIADRLAKSIDIIYNHAASVIRSLPNGRVEVDGQAFDAAVFCGNVKSLIRMLCGIELGGLTQEIENLKFHGTTVAFCKLDKNPYSWIYLPEKTHEAHRIICTGNFAMSNNQSDTPTGSVEFTDYVSPDDVSKYLQALPLNPLMIDYQYNEFSYPIQSDCTRKTIRELKDRLRRSNIYLVGRFAEWEYFNMDTAIASAFGFEI